MATEAAEEIDVLSVGGARPNFMKIAPLYAELTSRPSFRPSVVHTGQHYDPEMSDVFFEQLGLPEPDVYLGVGSNTHGRQTASIMTAFEDVLDASEPDVVVVVGDVNSTVACSLVAAKRSVPVAHVEAGLRSFDRDMPEELNRIVTDQLAELLFVTEESAVYHLADEGIPRERIHFVGNVMIDSLIRFRNVAQRKEIGRELDIPDQPYVAATFHRPTNVDDPAALRTVVSLLERLGEQWPVVFPVHPRTQENLMDENLYERLDNAGGIALTEPLGYLQFLGLMDGASLVVTDSGGIQEETTFLGVPCITVRDSTERPVTVEIGTNELAPLDVEHIERRAKERMGGERTLGERPPLWDGRASERIVDVLARRFGSGE